MLVQHSIHAIIITIILTLLMLFISFDRVITTECKKELQFCRKKLNNITKEIERLKT
jgi:hypothetical protein